MVEGGGSVITNEALYQLDVIASTVNAVNMYLRK